MKPKKALIFGITGQDGSYLAKYLLRKNYKVDGISKNFNKKNLIMLKIKEQIRIYNYNQNIIKLLKKNNYDEIYFFGGQSNVVKSFSTKKITYQTQVMPLVPVLEYLRLNKNKTKFLYACSSEIFGNFECKKRKNENSSKQPISPYGLSKLIGYEMIKSYRQMFGINVCSAIFFNHESPLRSKEYVVKKIIDYVKGDQKKKLKLGNINVKRDWGWGPEFIELCHRILNSKHIDDYVIATGKTNSLKKILKEIFSIKNLDYREFVSINEKKKRKFDINENYANIQKVSSKLKWKPKFGLKQIVHKMYYNEY